MLYQNLITFDSIQDMLHGIYFDYVKLGVYDILL